MHTCTEGCYQICTHIHFTCMHARPFRVASLCMHWFLAAQPLWSAQAKSGLGFMRTRVCEWRSHLALLAFRLIAFHLPHHRHRRAAHNTWPTCGHDPPMGSKLELLTLQCTIVPTLPPSSVTRGLHRRAAPSTCMWCHCLPLCCQFFKLPRLQP